MRTETYENKQESEPVTGSCIKRRQFVFDLISPFPGDPLVWRVPCARTFRPRFLAPVRSAHSRFLDFFCCSQQVKTSVRPPLYVPQGGLPSKGAFRALFLRWPYCRPVRDPSVPKLKPYRALQTEMGTGMMQRRVRGKAVGSVALSSKTSQQTEFWG